MNKKYIMMAVLLGMTRLLYAQSTIESLGIALDSVSQPMRYYLDKIEQRYPISIYYDNSKVSLSQPIRSEEKNITIKALFELGFESQSVDILFKERSILIQPKMRGSSSKKVTIKGFISDAANGEMLIGAVMGDVSTGKGVMTNTYGFYSLTLPQGEVFLRTSYVGFEKKKLT
ncbi:MAG: carboxypeptidase-like regulatory domain-containing protein, partial [Reichenbachiella sp.]